MTARTILLTGTMLGGGHHARAMEEGVDDFLVQPLDLEALRLRLRVAERIVSLTERVRTLEGILPMCSYCRRIRDDAQRECGCFRREIRRHRGIDLFLLGLYCRVRGLGSLAAGRKERPLVGL